MDLHGFPLIYIDLSLRLWIVIEFDGDFEFRNLRPGDYTIYVYSKDTTGATQVDENRMPIILDVEISDKKQELVVDDVTIYDEI